METEEGGFITYHSNYPGNPYIQDHRAFTKCTSEQIDSQGEEKGAFEHYCAERTSAMASAAECRICTWPIHVYRSEVTEARVLYSYTYSPQYSVYGN